MAALAPALLLLPGLLVVRAPWFAVAPLSLAFWTLSAWWIPAGTRGRFVSAVLAASCLLALLRLLPKHEVPPPAEWRPPPSAPPSLAPGLPFPPLASPASLAVAAVAVGLLAPLLRFDHAPGVGLAFHTTAARLVVWRDGLPASFEPLAPLAPFGAHAPALATLAADVALVTGLDPAPALAAVVAASAGLALVGLFALVSAWAPASVAAVTAVVALAVPPWPGFLVAFGAGEALLALGLVLPGAALLAGRASRSSAVAAAFLLAAGALAQPLLAALAGAAAGVASIRRGWFAARTTRVLATLALALALAAPGLVPLARALSASEALAVVRAIRAGELLAFLSLPLSASAALLAFGGARRCASSMRSAASAAALAAAGLLLVLRVLGYFGSGALDTSDRARLARAAAGSSWLSSVCAGDELRDFVPALTGRPAGGRGIRVPPVYSEEWTRSQPSPCDVHLDPPEPGR